MRYRHTIWRALALLVATWTLVSATACHHHRPGPGERAGRAVDHGLDRAGDAVEGAGRKVNRALPGD